MTASEPQIAAKKKKKKKNENEGNYPSKLTADRKGLEKGLRKIVASKVRTS
jgi:hypothetical protein